LKENTNDGTSSIISYENDYGFHLYPNPFKDYINIVLDNDHLSEISISDISGKEVFSKQFSEKLIKLDLYNLSSGTYILRVKNQDMITTKKIVLEK